ncbi:hypothetical protein [Actinoplanes sp. HUAS TT8]|uniref:hypothetical protein n=1 Tax=Actinoplanes sp. HUAS TT8 TaxID=3447453 RepID=UPI003F51DE28
MTFSAGRRGLLIGASSAFTGLLTGAYLPTPASAAPRWTAGCSPSSVRAAIDFLNTKFDEYGGGDALRVPRSYTGGFFETPTWTFVSSFAYDDALMILAWLAHGDVARAALLGDTLLYAQQHDPIGDGRTRASYQPDSFTVLNGTLDIGSPAAYTGNQAWVGMAFAHLYARTKQRRFLDGALRLARWIFANTHSDYGYSGGRTADDQAITYKATEHNIDVGAFFTMLASLTGESQWRTRAKTAFSFVAAMQDRASGHLWTGTDPDGVTTNRSPIPEDVQVWAFLATLDDRYRRSVSWVLDNLSAYDVGLHGVSFSDTDTTKVWLEGTAQTALALAVRRSKGDALLSKRLLWNISQAQGPNGGIPAASSDGLDTGFGDLYYRSFHTGATAWYLLAAQTSNPFRL